MLVAAPEAETPKHTHLTARLESGRELRFVDPRRFGRLEVRESRFTGPGTEPTRISADEFAELFHRSKAPIKAVLLNQKFLHGVGNIYADESLIRAGVRPRRRANTLTSAELNKLHAALQQVLQEAIRAGGSSVSDYVDADGEKGFFPISASRLRPRRQTLSQVQDADQEDHGRRPGNTLLSQVPEIAIPFDNRQTGRIFLMLRIQRS